MCYRRESAPPKKYVASKFDKDTLIYIKTVSKRDPDHFQVGPDEVAYIICHDGTSQLEYEGGFYRLVSKPSRIIWVKKVPRELKIGVPKEATGVNIGFHARVRLYPIDWDLIYRLFDVNKEEDTIKLTDIQDIIRDLAREIFIKLSKEMDLSSQEFKKRFNEELNRALASTKLAGFGAVISYLGLSTMCKLPEAFEEE